MEFPLASANLNDSLSLLTSFFDGPPRTGRYIRLIEQLANDKKRLKRLITNDYLEGFTSAAQAGAVPSSSSPTGGAQQSASVLQLADEEIFATIRQRWWLTVDGNRRRKQERLYISSRVLSARSEAEGLLQPRSDDDENSISSPPSAARRGRQLLRGAEREQLLGQHLARAAAGRDARDEEARIVEQLRVEFQERLELIRQRRRVAAASAAAAAAAASAAARRYRLHGEGVGDDDGGGASAIASAAATRDQQQQLLLDEMDNRRRFGGTFSNVTGGNSSGGAVVVDNADDTAIGPADFLAVMWVPMIATGAFDASGARVTARRRQQAGSRFKNADSPGPARRSFANSNSSGGQQSPRLGANDGDAPLQSPRRARQTVVTLEGDAAASGGGRKRGAAMPASDEEGDDDGGGRIGGRAAATAAATNRGGIGGFRESMRLFAQSAVRPDSELAAYLMDVFSSVDNTQRRVVTWSAFLAFVIERVYGHALGPTPDELRQQQLRQLRQQQSAHSGRQSPTGADAASMRASAAIAAAAAASGGGGGERSTAASGALLYRDSFKLQWPPHQSHWVHKVLFFGGGGWDAVVALDHTRCVVTLLEDLPKQKDTADDDEEQRLLVMQQRHQQHQQQQHRAAATSGGVSGGGRRKTFIRFDDGMVNVDANGGNAAATVAAAPTERKMRRDELREQQMQLSTASAIEDGSFYLDHEGYLHAAEYVAHEKLFVTASSAAQQLRFWSVHNRHELRFLNSFRVAVPGDAAITALRVEETLLLRDDVIRLFVGTRSGHIAHTVLGDAESVKRAAHGGNLELHGVLKLHDDAVSDMLVLPRSQRIVSAGLDGRLFSHDPQAEIIERSVQEFVGHKRGVLSLAHCRNYEVIISAGFEYHALCWAENLPRSPAFALIDAVSPHQHPICQVMAVPSTPHVYTIDTSGVVKLFDVRTLKAASSWNAFDPLRVPTNISNEIAVGGTANTRAMTDAIRASKAVAATGVPGGNGSSAVMAAAAAAAAASSSGGGGGGDSSATSETKHPRLVGGACFTGSKHRTIIIAARSLHRFHIEERNGDADRALALADPMVALDIGPRHFLTSANRVVRVWQQRDGKPVATHQAVRYSIAPVTVAVVDDAASKVIAGHADGALSVFHVRDGHLLRRYAHNRTAVLALVHDNRSGVIIASHENGEILFWRDRDVGASRLGPGRHLEGLFGAGRPIDPRNVRDWSVPESGFFAAAESEFPRAREEAMTHRPPRSVRVAQLLRWVVNRWQTLMNRHRSVANGGGATAAAASGGVGAIGGGGRGSADDAVRPVTRPAGILQLLHAGRALALAPEHMRAAVLSRRTTCRIIDYSVTPPSITHRLYHGKNRPLSAVALLSRANLVAVSDYHGLVFLWCVPDGGAQPILLSSMFNRCLCASYSHPNAEFRDATDDITDASAGAVDASLQGNAATGSGAEAAARRRELEQQEHEGGGNNATNDRAPPYQPPVEAIPSVCSLVIDPTRFYLVTGDDVGFVSIWEIEPVFTGVSDVYDALQDSRPSGAPARWIFAWRAHPLPVLEVRVAPHSMLAYVTRGADNMCAVWSVNGDWVAGLRQGPVVDRSWVFPYALLERAALVRTRWEKIYQALKTGELARLRRVRDGEERPRPAVHPELAAKLHRAVRHSHHPIHQHQQQQQRGVAATATATAAAPERLGRGDIAALARSQHQRLRAGTVRGASPQHHQQPQFGDASTLSVRSLATTAASSSLASTTVLLARGATPQAGVEQTVVDTDAGLAQLTVAGVTGNVNAGALQRGGGYRRLLSTTMHNRGAANIVAPTNNARERATALAAAAAAAAAAAKPATPQQVRVGAGIVTSAYQRDDPVRGVAATNPAHAVPMAARLAAAYHHQNAGNGSTDGSSSDSDSADLDPAFGSFVPEVDRLEHVLALMAQRRQLGTAPPAIHMATSAAAAALDPRRAQKTVENSRAAVHLQQSEQHAQARALHAMVVARRLQMTEGEVEAQRLGEVRVVGDRREYQQFVNRDEVGRGGGGGDGGTALPAPSALAGIAAAKATTGADASVLAQRRAEEELKRREDRRRRARLQRLDTRDVHAARHAMLVDYTPPPKAVTPHTRVAVVGSVSLGLSSAPFAISVADPQQRLLQQQSGLSSSSHESDRRLQRSRQSLAEAGAERQLVRSLSTPPTFQVAAPPLPLTPPPPAPSTPPVLATTDPRLLRGAAPRVPTSSMARRVTVLLEPLVAARASSAAGAVR